MSAGAWDVAFNGIGQGFGGLGTLSLRVDAGAMRVRVSWGGTGPAGTDPESANYWPIAALGGEFRLPGAFDNRGYADGSYALRVVGFFTDGSRQVEWLTAFFDLGNTAGAARTGGNGDDLMSGGAGNDSFAGSNGNDWLSGGNGSDLLGGGIGNDNLGGGDGADTLLGDAGQDLVSGDGGDDLLRGGHDADTIRGGDGNDALRGETGDDLAAGDAGHDWLRGEDGNDTLFGDGSNGAEDPIPGHDTLSGGNGDDDLHGGAGNDSLAGDAGDDNIDGGAGHDTLIGGGNGDILVGSDGNDRLVGGAGIDSFEGGPGNDTLITEADGETDFFVHGSSLDGFDRIIGFQPGEDAILFLTVSEGDVGPDRFVSTATAIAEAGIYVIYNSATGLLQIDDNGSAAGGVRNLARLVGLPGEVVPVLNYSDFIFAG